MSDASPSLLQRLARWGGIGALLVAALVWGLYAWASSTATTYQQIVPVDQALREVNQLTYGQDPTGKDADIVAIYGSPKGEPTEYVFVDESRVIRPEEKPSLALLTAPEEGQPTQLKAVWFLATRVSAGAGVAALLLLGLAWLLGRRRAA